MSDVTRILSAIDAGDPHAASQLLPLVYDELRKLAAAKMAKEKPGQTLDATALVHEAYIRLVPDERRSRSSSEDRQDEPGGSPGFANRRHFFAAAAQAMQRILVDLARRKKAAKRGGAGQRQDLDDIVLPAPERREDLLFLDEALEKLAKVDPQAAELVRLRYFAGFSLLDAAEILQVSPRTGHRLWAYARAFLHRELASAIA
jgi:RNA polymerase sigma factor (sigma-70 family)